MDYRNLIIRSIVSIFLFSLMYFFINIIPQYIKYIIIVLYIIVLLELLFFFKKHKLIIFLYIVISFICLEYYLINFFNNFIFLYYILLIIFFDTFSYIFGSLFGNRKILPKISPNKTYFGFISGSILSICISYIVLINFINVNSFSLIIFSVFFILLAFLGDLLESYFKRQSNLKNSSYFLPGHGGFFDRLDGFILSAYMLPLFGYFL